MALQTQEIRECVGGRQRVRHRVRCLPWITASRSESTLLSSVQAAWASVESSDGIKLLIDEQEHNTRRADGMSQQVVADQNIRIRPDMKHGGSVNNRQRGVQTQQPVQTHRDRFLQQGLSLIHI